MGSPPQSWYAEPLSALPLETINGVRTGSRMWLEILCYRISVIKVTYKLQRYGYDEDNIAIELDSNVI